MEVGMSLNAMVRLPLTGSRAHDDYLGLAKHSLSTSRPARGHEPRRAPRRGRPSLVVEAKGKRGMQARQFQRPPPPSLPKIEDDGNPRFVIFIRMANVRPNVQVSVFLFSKLCWL